jgi:hypothetical protein
MPEHLSHNKETKNLNQDVSADLSSEALAQDETSEKIEALAERLNLKEQYLAQVKVLYQSGLLENFPVDPKQDRYTPEMGIVGIDGQEYIMPSYEDVLERLKDPEKRKLLETKAEQGFTKLLLVPFAMPLSVLIQRYKDILLKINQETGIKATDGSKLELNESNPFFVCEDYIQCDNPDTPKDKQIEYHVTTYDAKTKEARGGSYKSELLKESDNAWRILLIENNPDLPAQGKGQTIAGRKQLEANQSPKQYLKDLQTQLQYQGESGLTPEANFILYLDALTRNQTALDDWQGQGKANFLVGNYLSGGVPSFGWGRGDRRSHLRRNNPGNSNSSVCCRPSVEF